MLRKLLMFVLAAALLGALAAAAYFFWQRSSSDALPTGVHRANGRLELVRVDVAAKYPGRLASVQFQEGDAVQAGQVLAVQEDAELQARLTQAKAQQARAGVIVIADRSPVSAENQPPIRKGTYIFHLIAAFTAQVDAFLRESA